jgi:hypothetical protein
VQLDHHAGLVFELDVHVASRLRQVKADGQATRGPSPPVVQGEGAAAADGADGERAAGLDDAGDGQQGLLDLHRRRAGMAVHPQPELAELAGLIADGELEVPVAATIDGPGVTQSRTLRDAEMMARDYIEPETGAAPGSFEVLITPEVGDGLAANDQAVLARTCCSITVPGSSSSSTCTSLPGSDR